MTLKGRIRKWREQAERNYRDGFEDRLAGRPGRYATPGGARDAGIKEADRVRGGKWPADLELPVKVWARYLARRLGEI